MRKKPSTALTEVLYNSETKPSDKIKAALILSVLQAFEKGDREAAMALASMGGRPVQPMQRPEDKEEKPKAKDFY